MPLGPRLNSLGLHHSERTIVSRFSTQVLSLGGAELFGLQPHFLPSTALSAQRLRLEWHLEGFRVLLAPTWPRSLRIWVFGEIGDRTGIYLLASCRLAYRDMCLEAHSIYVGSRGVVSMVIPIRQRSRRHPPHRHRALNIHATGVYTHMHGHTHVCIHTLTLTPLLSFLSLSSLARLL